MENLRIIKPKIRCKKKTNKFKVLGPYLLLLLDDMIHCFQHLESNVNRPIM